MPNPVALERGDLDAALEVVAGDLHNVIQRALDAVVNAGNQARPQLDRQGHLHGLDRLAGAQA